MAKLSLSWALNRKKRIRIGTGLAVLLLLFFGISLMVSKNPKGTKAAETISTSRSIFADNLAYDDKDLIINGVSTEVTIYGQHTFKSLTIIGGKLTHAALVPGTDFNISTSNLTSTGENKKVNLVIEGDLTLDNGGSINVDGKGYPGGFFQKASDGSGGDKGCTGDNEGDLYGKNGITVHSDTIKSINYGFGPGGGISYQNYNERSGGGGGFGGAGKVGTSATLGSTFYDYNRHQHGSGGGAASYDSHPDETNCGNGGDGGGVIILSVSSIKIVSPNSMISAKGNSGNMFQDDGQSVGSGGGSGGLIKISTKSFDYSPSQLWSIMDYNAGLYPGSIGKSVVTGFDNNIFFNIYATGGDRSIENSKYFATSGSGGGGGWIVIDKIVSQPVTIKKTLEPVSRGGVNASNCLTDSPVGCFNPYALQQGDRIQVNLSVTNLIPGNLHMKDEMLKVPYSSPVAYCKYVVSSLLFGTVDPIETTDDKLVWNYTVPVTETEKDFSYKCDVVQQ